MSLNREPFIYDEPMRGDVHCTHCCEEIEAYGHEVVSLVIQGSYPYLWRHVETGSVSCEPKPPPKARPYDDFAAYRQLHAEQEKQTKAQLA